MPRLHHALTLLCLANLAHSNPLFTAHLDTDRIDRYNPLRTVMDVLCTNFETSFCRDGTTPATINHIVPESPSSSASSIPPLCHPSNFADYRRLISPRPFTSHSTSHPSATKQDCCVTCYNARDCLSWTFDPAGLECTYFTATERAEDGFESEVCPLGVDVGSYEEMPGWPAVAGSGRGRGRGGGQGHNYGPCAWEAPLGSERATVRGTVQEESATMKERLQEDSATMKVELQEESPSLRQEVLEL